VTAGSELRRHEAFHSTWLDADRDLTIYLPAGYDTADAPHPLLILHDGQNLFDPLRAHGGETWHVADAVDALVAAGTIPPLVVVGVDHGREARVREYTPTPGRVPDAGLVDRHARFLVDEVLPFVATHYAVRTDFDALGLGGSSLGGLATVGVAMAAPGRFGRLIVMSPSVWWDRRAILRRLRRAPLDPRTRVWIDAGTKEGAKTVRDARDLADLIRAPVPGDAPTGADNAARVQFVVDPEGDHSERSWARRIGAAIAFCYRQAPATLG
jgi:enterochelin esterase-like enzyme